MQSVWDSRGYVNPIGNLRTSYNWQVQVYTVAGGALCLVKDFHEKSQAEYFASDRRNASYFTVIECLTPQPDPFESFREKEKAFLKALRELVSFAKDFSEDQLLEFFHERGVGNDNFNSDSLCNAALGCDNFEAQMMGLIHWWNHCKGLWDKR